MKIAGNCKIQQVVSKMEKDEKDILAHGFEAKQEAKTKKEKVEKENSDLR